MTRLQLFPASCSTAVPGWESVRDGRTEDELVEQDFVCVAQPGPSAHQRVEHPRQLVTFLQRCGDVLVELIPLAWINRTALGLPIRGHRFESRLGGIPSVI